MAYFTPAFSRFFRDLSVNNSTEWFNQNRTTYEKEVKQPFSVFVEEMINRIKKYEPEISIKASDAISRINKDIRFSKEKTPYNTHVSANISALGKKSKTYPGFFFRFSHENILLIGGSYLLEPVEIDKVRKSIVKKENEFSSLLHKKSFKEKFGTLKGEQNKKISPEFLVVQSRQPLIANKQFYYSAELSPSFLLRPDLPDILMEYYQAGKGLNTFLKESLK